MIFYLDGNVIPYFMLIQHFHYFEQILHHSEKLSAVEPSFHFFIFLSIIYINNFMFFLTLAEIYLFMCCYYLCIFLNLRTVVVVMDRYQVY